MTETYLHSPIKIKKNITVKKNIKIMKKVFKHIGHNDHGITEKQLEFIQNNKELLGLLNGTLIKKIIQLPKGIGTVKSALYGPKAGDNPIAEKDVFYIKRGGRKGPTRMINKPTRLTSTICVIGIKNGPAFTMYGTQSDKPSPMEIWDNKMKFLSNNEQEEIRKFWEEHAISSY